MNPEEDFNFDMDPEREKQIVFEEAAKAIVPIYRAFLAQGLTESQAAHLVAAMSNQHLPRLNSNEERDD